MQSVPQQSNSNIYRWWILVAATITQMCAALSTQGIGVFAGFMQHDFRLSNSEVGILASTLNVAPIFGLLLIGKFLDRVGERLPIFFGMLIISISMLLMSFTHQYYLLLVALFICGIGYSPIQPGGGRAIHLWFSNIHRGFAMGVRQAALPLGGALAAIIFPWIIHYSNWRYAAIFAAIMVLGGGIMFLLIYRNLPPPIHPQKDLSILAQLKLLHRGELPKIVSIGIVLVAIQTFTLIFWMLFIHTMFHVALISSAWYLCAIQVAGTIGRIALSTLGSILNNGYRQVTYALTMILILLAVIIASLPLNTPLSIVMLISVIWGFCSFGWYGPWVVWLTEAALAEHIGTTLSTSMALNQIAIVLTPLVFGVLLDATGSYTVVWLCLAAVASICLIKNLYHKLQ